MTRAKTPAYKTRMLLAALLVLAVALVVLVPSMTRADSPTLRLGDASRQRTDDGQLPPIVPESPPDPTVDYGVCVICNVPQYLRPGPQTLVFKPTATAVFGRVHRDMGLFCDTQSGYSPSGELQVGYFNYKYDDAIRTCVYNIIWQTGFRFDLSMLRQARSTGWFPTDAVLTFKETPYPGKTDEPSLAYHWYPVPAGDNLYSLTPTQTCWPRLALPTADWSGPSRDLIANDVIRDPGVIGRWSVYPETLAMVTDLSLSTESLGFLLIGDNENMDANNASCRSKIEDVQLTVTYTIPAPTATAPSTPTPSSRLPGTTVITAVNPGDCAACVSLVITPTPTPLRQPATYHDPTPETGTGWPQLTISTQGEAVRSLQYLLQQSGATLSVSGVDGKFGQETLQAVMAFQKAQGIMADGVVGQKTWLALIVTVQQGSQGAAVRAVQSQLKSRGQAVTVDGNFGGQTDSAVRAYQQAHGLTVDGQVGPQTWKALIAGT